MHSLVVAALAELADRAVVIQNQAGWQTRTCHLLEFSQEALRALGVWIESDLGYLAFPSVPYDSVGGEPALAPREYPSKQFQQEPLSFPDSVRFVKEHRDIISSFHEKLHNN